MARYSFVDEPAKTPRYSFVDETVAETADNEGFMDRLSGAFMMGMDASKNYILNAERFISGTDEDDSVIASTIMGDLRERQEFGQTEGQKKLNDAMQALNSVSRWKNTADDVGSVIDQMPELPFAPGAKAGAKTAFEFARSLPEIWDVVKTAVTNPGDTLVSSAESAPNTLFAMGGGTTGGAAGAAIGAGAGLLATKSGAGASAGAKLGAKIGGQGGMFATSGAIEFGASLQEEVLNELDKRKLEPSEDNIKAILKDPAFRAEAAKVAAAKGIVTPATDLAMFRVAGGMGALPGVKGKIGALGIETLSEPLSEGMGQAAQVAVSSDQDRQIDRAELAAEAIYALPTSAASATAATAFEKLVGNRSQKPRLGDTDPGKLDQDYQQATANLENLYNEAVANGDTAMADAVVSRSKGLRDEYVSRRKAIDPTFVGDIDPLTQAQEKFTQSTNVDEMNAAANEILKATPFVPLGQPIKPTPFTPIKSSLVTPNQEAIDTLSQVQPQQDDVQSRLEAASQQAVDPATAFQNEMTRAAVDSAMKAIESRNGVATPEEAALLQESGFGRPFDRIEGEPVQEKRPSGPRKIWTGGQPEGYKTENGAKIARIQRERAEPDLQWTVEQLPNGNFEVAGYDIPRGTDFSSQVTGTQSDQESTPIGSQPTPEVTAPQTVEDGNVDRLISEAESNGVVLSDADKAEIRKQLSRAGDLAKKAGRMGMSDPMNKGNAFPMGVGFTKMTKRKEQRLDASVRRAGEASKLYKQAEYAKNQAEALLSGKGTDLDKANKADKTSIAEVDLARKIAGMQKGDKISGFTVERVNKGSDGYPTSITISGDGIVKGVGDKINIAKDLYRGDGERFRQLFDEARNDAKPQPETVTVQPEVRLKANGKPYVSEGQARASSNFRSNPGAQVVPVEGGFGVQLSTDNQVSAPVLQNRNRATAASIEQMTAIAANPDYLRLSPSRDFANGAPVVEPGADVVATGRNDTAVTANGRRIPVQYAVVEADALLPSNNVDGTTNATYAQGEQGKSRAIAGNGRVAGLQSAFRNGTATQYVEDLASDDAHGIDPAVIRGMKSPVLVRIMPRDEITDTIGDESNTTATAQLSPSEQAKNDGKRIDVRGIALNDDGEITRQAVEQFIASMPQAEKSGLMDGQNPNRQAYDRLENVIFAEAYESDTLLRLQAEATDPEVRNIMSGLRIAAGRMAQLKGAGVYDIRALVVEAAEVAVNAKRSGQPLAQFIQQADIGRSPDVQAILESFSQNVRSSKRIGQSLSNLADVFYAEYSRSDADMFGTVERRQPTELMGEIYGTAQAETGSTQDATNTGRSESLERGDEGQPVGREQESAGRAEGEAEPLALAQESESDRQSREQREAEARKAEEKIKRDADAKAKKEADEKITQDAVRNSVDRFELGQDVDQQLSGQEAMFSKSQPTKNAHTATTIRAALEKAFPGVFASLENAGLARVITSDQLPDSIKDGKRSVSGINAPDALIESLSSIHPEVDAFLSISSDRIKLDMLKMPEAIRGQGIGSRFMETLTGYADEKGMIITLTAAGDFGGSMAGQQRFYKRHGFEMNKGRNKDFSISDNMIRQPLDARYSKDGKVLAYVANGKVTFVADNIPKGHNVKGLMLHEIGVHLKQLGQNDQEFKRLQNQFKLMAKKKGSLAAEAMARVPKDTAEHLKVEEGLGYFVEQNSDLPFSQKVIAWFRAKIREWASNAKGRDRLKIVQWAKNLSDADIVYMATEAVRDAKNADTIAQNDGVMASMADESAPFPESNRLTNISKAGAMWQAIVSENPAAKNAGDTVTVYRATVGDQIRRNDYVALNREIAEGHLENLADRGETGEIVSMEVPLDSLLMANDATEFVYAPKPDTKASRSEVDFDQPRNYSFTESDYRPAVVSWAKERFGDQVAPNGKPAWQNFTRWFGDSAVVDANGRPLVVYHGTESVEAIDSFDDLRIGSKTDSGWMGRGFYFGSQNTANTYSGFSEFDPKETSGAVYPAYLAIQSPLVLKDTDRNDGQRTMVREALDLPDEASAKDVQDGLISSGYDGVIYERFNPYGEGYKEFAAFRPEQIKSATGNTGNFSPDTGDIRYSRANDTLTDIADRVLATPQRKTVIGKFKQAIADHSENFGVWAKQGIVDEFASIADLEKKARGVLLDASESAYKAAAFTKNSNTVLETAMHFGAVQYVDGGIEIKENTKGLMEILEPLAKGDLLREWEVWAGAVRAKRLLREGKERNYTADDVARIESLVYGEKLEMFKQVHREWIQFNKATLDFAESAGLINAEQRAQWEKDDYVPFHRVSEFDATQAESRGKGGLSGQKSGIKQLTGGVEKISIVESMVRNTAHMIDASMKNVAMQRTVNIAKELDVIEEVRDARMSEDQARQRLEAMGIEFDEDSFNTWKSLLEKHDASEGTVTVSENGKTKRYIVHDPLLLSAMTSLGPTGVEGIMTVLRIPKKLLTDMVTSDPSFALRNFIRDTLSSWATVHSGKRNPLTSAVKGVIQSYQNSDAQKAMMAQGVGGGGFYDTSPEGARAHLDKLAGKGKTVTTLGEVWQAYRKVLGTTENANRIAIYEAALKAGATKAEAAYQAMDVMNFSRHGEFKAVRILIQLVPFMNARIQGLDRLWRGAKEGTTEWYQFNRAFMIKGTMITAATLALLAANWDEDEYWELEEWERDTYYHFFINGEHYRMPKPFEVGAIFSTIPERMFEQFREDANMKLLGKRMLHMIGDTFAMDPTPQFVKPALEVAMNRSTFTGRDILSMGMKFASPEAQYSPYTSKTFIAMADAMPDSAPDWMRSPARLEHLFRGYFGTMGGYALMGSDYLARVATDAPKRPELRMRDIPVASSFIRDGVGSSKHVGRAYDMAKSVNEINAAIKKYMEEGKREKVQELRLSNRDKLMARAALNKATRRMSEISSEMKKIYDNPVMTPEVKRQRIDKLIEQRNDLAKQISERYFDRF